ncbi:MAG: hypothetical protein ACLFVP_03895 [Candidatus Bathyarchaeia archaeon]
MNIEESTGRAVEEYNRYHSPEAEAELLNIEGSEVLIGFTGSFCTTCGFHDYIDDYRILLEDGYGIESEIKELEEVPGGARAHFKIIDHTNQA